MDYTYESAGEGNNINIELPDPKKLENQYVFVSAHENARTAQYYALLMTIRAALMSDDGYNVDRVTRAVVAAFDELEGRLPC